MKKKTKEQLETELRQLEKRAAEKKAALRKLTTAEQAKERADNYRILESMAQRYGRSEKEVLYLADRILIAAGKYCMVHNSTLDKFIEYLNGKSGM